MNYTEAAKAYDAAKALEPEYTAHYAGGMKFVFHAATEEAAEAEAEWWGEFNAGAVVVSLTKKVAA